MSLLTLNEYFKVDDVLTDMTSVILSDPTGTYGVKRNDTDAIVVADGVAMTKSATGSYTHSFTQPEAGLTYTYWTEWTYGGETFWDEHTVSGSVTDDFHSTAGAMDKADMVAWLKVEFQPLILATPDTALRQIVDNAVRYWNTHSAYKISTMVDAPSSGGRVQITNAMKAVVTVWPSASTTWIWNDHPLWTMMGIQVLDNITGDLVMLSESFRNYRVYVGSDMRWLWTKSEDPTKGGYLSIINVPTAAEKLCVIGTKRITAGESIKVEYIKDWVLNYSKALLKQIEGNTLRKGAICNVPTDGDTLVREGVEEQKDLKVALAENGRWVVFAKRA